MLKIDLINEAYQEIRISGLTTQPLPSELEYALTKLESMASEWEDVRNICVNYNFENEPDPNSEAGIKLGYRQAFATNLASRLIASFGKTPSPALITQASQSFAGLSTATAVVRETQYPERQPVGSGNSLRYNRWRRFYRQNPRAPIDCDTQQITQGEINDYQLNLVDYLEDGETVESYTYEASPKISVISESLSGLIWSYRAEAAETAEQLERIQLTVVTDIGREQTFTINFNVAPLPNITRQGS
ncbi:MAG: hypothetical protein CMI54_04590 [Parcubacteria group bacterium]|nr:hypothetical protein [Parcubacteria group bacterium]|tara:strand:+ start:18674 stop:19411 length:738 start_codon:yes stop_codon:yes gene_type:complete